ncbi:CmcI family methyltransferase [Rhodopila sp.]|uniref:CmcI family methyltransferase n=1 Tax=Rhodopila sp. TaxID=2480087 RepID=UPI003D0A7A88
MHDTAYEHGRLFFELYSSNGCDKVVDLGSQDVNGSLRDHCPPGACYIGLDVIAANGVDVVVDPGRALPIASDSIDAVVTSSAFEHDILFWDTFLQLARIVRPGGLIYVNAPSNHTFHRYPLDCWRFYPDAGVALVRWAQRSGCPLELIESFIAQPKQDGWADFIAVFRKSGDSGLRRAGRIAEHTRASNVYDIELKCEGALQAETEHMPDMLIAEGLRADLAAVEAAQQEAMRRTSMLSAELSTAQSEANALGRKVRMTAERIAELESALADAGAQLSAAKDAIHTIWNSTSWRVTAGLRWLGRRMHGKDASQQIPLEIETTTGIGMAFLEQSLDIKLRDVLPTMQHRIVSTTTYFGVQTLKNPLDFWVYQELITRLRPDVIVEVGNRFGGSALALAHLCDLMGHGRIVGLDVDHSQLSSLTRAHKRVSLIEGDACGSFPAVRAMIGPAEQVLVIEDSAHTFENTLNVLNTFSPLVQLGGYFIVEDSICHHGLEVGPHPGPFEAIEAFIAAGSDFVVDREMESFLITWNPKGFLRRTSASPG